jgi:hypothetical protein
MKTNIDLERLRVDVAFVVDRFAYGNTLSGSLPTFPESLTTW